MPLLVHAVARKASVTHDTEETRGRLAFQNANWRLLEWFLYQHVPLSSLFLSPIYKDLGEAALPESRYKDQRENSQVFWLRKSSRNFFKWKIKFLPK